MPPSVGQTVTVTIAVAVPDGATLCLGDRCQTLGAGDGLAAQETVAAGAVVTFADVPPGTYDLVLAVGGEPAFAARVVVGDGPVSVTLGPDDAVGPVPSATSSRAAGGEGAGPTPSDGPGPSATGSRGAAPVLSEPSGIRVLPDTGVGTGSPTDPTRGWLAALAVLVLGASLVSVAVTATGGRRPRRT